jgi:TATA-box binding protein (TBP) (component of TFIID and TFIIIB)
MCFFSSGMSAMREEKQAFHELRTKSKEKQNKIRQNTRIHIQNKVCSSKNQSEIDLALGPTKQQESLTTF